MLECRDTHPEDHKRSLAAFYSSVTTSSAAPQMPSIRPQMLRIVVLLPLRLWPRNGRALNRGNFPWVFFLSAGANVQHFSVPIFLTHCLNGFYWRDAVSCSRDAASLHNTSFFRDMISQPPTTGKKVLQIFMEL